MKIAIDREALRRKYREERDKRLRPDGNEQYIHIEDHFPHYLDDPYTEVQARQAKSDHVTFAFIGGGYAGLVTAARLVEQGVSDVRIVDKAGDFGGTWDWNRYPGAQCDTASLIYMPLLEETGHVPTQNYAHGPEILEHCRRIGRRYGLYDNALFHTRVSAVEWQEEAGVWRIRSDRGDDFTARYIGMGTGPLHMPKLPGVPGIDDFQGHAFHTSRWDYRYTGGDPAGAPLDRLGDKRVALIGTGATAVQCVPHLAGACATFYVCQRTPSSVDARDIRPIDRDWFAAIAEPGWQRRWMENFAANLSGAPVENDLVRDGWTDIPRRFHAGLAQLPEEERKNPARWAEMWEQADFEKMEEIRRRVDAVVQDAQTAARLKAWYGQLCKRPCFHNHYLEAFNRASTVLLDTDGRGVERITPRGVVVGGVEYPVDCIIYATGFEVGTDRLSRTGFEVTGRGGRTLSEHWQQGMRSLHGIHVRNFPNAFLVQPAQGANFIANVPHNIVESAAAIAHTVRHAEASGAARVEVSAAAEEAWVQLIASGTGLTLPNPDCTPGYYNNEGQPLPAEAHSYAGYPMGAVAFFGHLQQWRDSGAFEGLEFGLDASGM